MGVALSVILFFFRCGIIFLEVVFFIRSQSLFLKRCCVRCENLFSQREQYFICLWSQKMSPSTKEHFCNIGRFKQLVHSYTTLPGASDTLSPCLANRLTISTGFMTSVPDEDLKHCKHLRIRSSCISL